MERFITELEHACDSRLDADGAHHVAAAAAPSVAAPSPVTAVSVPDNESWSSDGPDVQSGNFDRRCVVM